jgi:hypothetical protein
MHPRLCGPVAEPEAQTSQPKLENPTDRQNLMSIPTPRLGTYFISKSSTPGNTRRAHIDSTSSWFRKQIWARYTRISIPILSLVFTEPRFFQLGSYPPRLGKLRKLNSFIPRSERHRAQWPAGLYLH